MSIARMSSDVTQMEEFQFFSKNVRLLHYLGLWPTSSGNGRYWFLIPRLPIIYIIFEVIGIRCRSILFFWSDMKLGDLCMQVNVLIAAPMVLLVIVNHMLHMRRAEALLPWLQQMHDPEHQQDKYQRDLLAKVKKITDLIAWIPWITLVASATTSFLTAPILIYMKESSTGGHYPYDVKATPYLHLTVIVQALVGPVFLPSALACGIFYASIIIQVIALFFILNHNLRNIRPHCEALRMTSQDVLSDEDQVEDEGEGQTSEMRDPSGLQVTDLSDDSADEASEQVESVEVHETALDVTHESVYEEALFGEPWSIRWTIPLIRRHVDPDVKVTRLTAAKKISNAHALEVEMQLRLKNCIKMHQELIRFCGELNNITSASLMASVVLCLVPTAIGILYLTMVPFEMNTLVFASNVGLALSVLYTACWFGDQISEQSGLVGEAAYSCDWFQASDSFKKSLRIIISNANQPVVLMAGGFVPITVKTFDTVVKQAYSYYTVFKTVANPEEHA